MQSDLKQLKSELLQCQTQKKDKSLIESVFEKIIDRMKKQNIDGISPQDCKVAFLHDSETYLNELIKLLEQQFSMVSIDENKINFPNSFTLFNYQSLQPLIFSNLNDDVFASIIKNVFNIYYEKIMKPIQKKTQEDSIINDSNFEEIVNIIDFKNYNYQINVDKYPQYYNEFIQKNQVNVEMLLESLIDLHTQFNYDLKDQLTAIHDKYDSRSENNNILNEFIISIKDKFTWAPVKKLGRSLEKIREKMIENPEDSFPFHELKDLSRGSYVFDNISKLLDQQQFLKKEIENHPSLNIIQVKNMFKNQFNIEDDSRQDYKDIKLIVCWNYKEFSLICELQLILQPILEMKNSMHKFQDISRSNFEPMNQYRQLQDQGQNSTFDGKSAQIWREDDSNLFHIIKSNMIKMQHKIKECESRGDEFFDESDNVYNYKVFKHENLYIAKAYLKKGFKNQVPLYGLQDIKIKKLIKFKINNQYSIRYYFHEKRLLKQENKKFTIQGYSFNIMTNKNNTIDVYQSIIQPGHSERQGKILVYDLKRNKCRIKNVVNVQNEITDRIDYSAKIPDEYDCVEDAEYNIRIQIKKSGRINPLISDTHHHYKRTTLQELINQQESIKYVRNTISISLNQDDEVELNNVNDTNEEENNELDESKIKYIDNDEEKIEDNNEHKDNDENETNQKSNQIIYRDQSKGWVCRMAQLQFNKCQSGDRKLRKDNDEMFYHVKTKNIDVCPECMDQYKDIINNELDYKFMSRKDVVVLENKKYDWRCDFSNFGNCKSKMKKDQQNSNLESKFFHSIESGQDFCEGCMKVVQYQADL